MQGVTPLTVTASLCGHAATSACAPGDNLAVHRLLEQAPEGSVLVVDAGGRTNRATSASSPPLTRGTAASRGRDRRRDPGRRALAILGFPVFHHCRAPAGCVKERVVSVNCTAIDQGARLSELLDLRG